MLEQIKLLIRSGNPILSFETRDEDRTTELVRQAADELHMTVFEWSVTTGLTRTRPEVAETGFKRGKVSQALDHVLDNDGEKELYLFKDLGPHCKDPLVRRQIRDLHTRSDVHLILVEGSPLLDDVRRLTVPLQMRLPDADELEQVIRDTYRQIKDSSYYEITASLTKRGMEQMVQTLRGLTCTEAARVVASAIHFDYALTHEDLPRLVEGKRNLLQSAGCLESINVNFTPEEIGGLDNLKAWLARRREGMTSKARIFGLDPPRGILLLGVQGCGKRLCAKVVAADWRMPLLRMDPACFIRSTSAKARIGCARHWHKLSRWHRQCCGLMRSKRRLPRQGQSRLTVGCHSECLALSYHGCRIIAVRSLWWRPRITLLPCHRS